MSTVKIGLEISGKVLGSVRSAFGNTQKTVEILGRTIDKTSARQERLGNIMGRSMMTSHRSVTGMVSQYNRMGTAIEKATRAQIGLNRAMTSQQAGVDNRRQLRGQIFETVGHGAVVGAPIIGAVKTFMRLEDAATELKMTMMKADGSVGAFNEVLKQSKALGKALPGTPENFMRLGTALKEQGVSDSKIIGGGLRTAANLNIVMGMNEYEGGTFFARMLESHGLNENEFEKAADFTQRAKFAFGMKKDDMSYAMSYYGSNVNKLGLTGIDNYEKLLAVQGIGAQNSIESSKFGTGFSGMLSRLAVGPKMIGMATKGLKGEVKDILGKSGVTFDFFDDKRNFKGIDHMIKEMEKLNIIRSKFGAEGELLVSNALFGEENGRLAGIIAKNGFEGYQRNLDLMREQANLNARITERTSTLSSAIEQLGGVAESTFATFGSVFKDDIRAFANTAQNFIENTLEPWITKNKGLILGTVKVVGSLLSLKLGILGISYAASTVAAPFKAIWVGYSKMKALGSMFNLTKLSGGFSVISKGATTLGKALRFGSVTKGIGMATKAVLTFGRAFMFTPIGAIVTGIAVAALLIYKYWKPIKAYFSGVFSGIRDALLPIEPMFKRLGEVFSPAINAIKEFFGATSESEEGARSFGYTVGTVIGNILNTVVTIGAMIVDGWSMIFDGMFNIVGSVWGEITTAFDGGIGGISALITNWSPLGLFYSAFAGVLNWFGVELPAKFTGFGQMILDGLLGGLKSKFEEVKSWWNMATGFFSNILTKKNEIHSPSRLFMRHGGHIIDGLAIGLQKNIPKLKIKSSHYLTD